MDDIKRRLDKIEENCSAQGNYCKAGKDIIVHKLAEGQSKMAGHEQRLIDLERERDNLSKRVKSIEDMANKIMAGLVVASILLAVNIIVTIAANGANAVNGQ